MKSVESEGLNPPSTSIDDISGPYRPGQCHYVCQILLHCPNVTLPLTVFWLYCILCDTAGTRPDAYRSDRDFKKHTGSFIIGAGMQAADDGENCAAVVAALDPMFGLHWARHEQEIDIGTSLSRHFLNHYARRFHVHLHPDQYIEVLRSLLFFELGVVGLAMNAVC